MKPVDIVHIVLGKANPERQNGVNKVVYELAQRQQLEGHNVAVWGITKNPVVNYSDRLFETRLFQDHSNKFRLDQTLKNAIESAPENVLFHLHGGFLPQLFSAARLLSKNGHDYIYTPHGAYNENAVKRSWWKKQLYIMLFERFVVNHSRFVHVIGQSEINGTRSIFGSTTPVVLIPNGQDKIIDLTLKRKRIPGRIEFGFIGRLDIHTKGLDILIEGFQKFVEDENDGILYIIGDGAQREYLEQFVEEMNLSEQVIFCGSLFGEEKRRFLKQMDYICLTSRNEGLPGVILEATALGVPAIVSRETNLADFIDTYNAGFSLNKNTPDELWNAMCKALDVILDMGYEHQQRNAQRMIEEEFCWADISRRLIEAYHAA